MFISLFSGLGNWRWRGTSLNMLRANLIARILVDRLHYILLASKLFDIETKPMFSIYIYQCIILVHDITYTSVCLMTEYLHV